MNTEKQKAEATYYKTNQIDNVNGRDYLNPRFEKQAIPRGPFSIEHKIKPLVGWVDIGRLQAYEIADRVRANEVDVRALRGQSSTLDQAWHQDGYGGNSWDMTMVSDRGELIKISGVTGGEKNIYGLEEAWQHPDDPLAERGRLQDALKDAKGDAHYRVSVGSDQRSVTIPARFIGSAEEWGQFFMPLRSESTNDESKREDFARLVEAEKTGDVSKVQPGMIYNLAGVDDRELTDDLRWLRDNLGSKLWRGKQPLPLFKGEYPQESMLPVYNDNSSIRGIYSTIDTIEDVLQQQAIDAENEAHQIAASALYKASFKKPLFMRRSKFERLSRERYNEEFFKIVKGNRTFQDERDKLNGIPQDR